MKYLRESFEVHDTLNPSIWDTNSMLMLPDVRRKLIDIVTAFEDFIDVPISIIDAQVCGSNASYNYTSDSDLDLHIIADFSFLADQEGLLQKLYDAKKTVFNNETDIKIHGIDVEIYVQDVRSSVMSNGIYSICDNAWIKEPKPITSITKHNLSKELSKWEDKIQQVLQGGDYDMILDTINTLYLMRSNSLAVDGEYGKGNSLFKEIRNKGLLQKLKSAMLNSLSKNLSLESLSSGQFIHRFNEYENNTTSFAHRCI